ncbi:MAG: hypothetical protein IRZ16_05575 [Myxococcaceae bacterium]|nr:hypothetical protein [Myxococcaceae bacterium]
MNLKAFFSAGLGIALIAVAAFGLACGANGVDAPAPKPRPTDECASFEQLMPRFTAALKSGRTEGLRVVVEKHLLVSSSGREDQAPPMNDVLRAIFQTLARFAALPPETGAAPGEVCAQNPPPVALAHPICEMRRSMDVLVHQAKGLDAVRTIDPLLRSVMLYILGRPPASPNTRHFEVAQVVSDMCQQTATCQLNDTLDLVIAMVAFAETDDGRAMMDRFAGIATDPALEPFLQDDGQMYGGENGIVALANLVMSTVQAMNDPSELDALPIDSLPKEMKPKLQAMVGDLKKMLDPTREPNILGPMKKVISCLRTADENSDLIRMVYRLGFEADLPEFNLANITGVVSGLRETDSRGTLLHLVGTLAQAVRSDEAAVDSAASVCRTLFSTKVAPGESQSPAELALPVIADLYSQNITGEALCAADTLLYGCAGGTAQPACEAAGP